MKNQKTTIVALVAVILLILFGYGIHAYLRALQPAIGPAPAPIADLINGSGQNPQTAAPASPGPTENLTDFPLDIPEGTTLSVFAEGVDARFMAFDSDGVLYLSQTKSNKVVALPDEDGDGRADKAVDIIIGINLPHGLAFAFAPSRADATAADRGGGFSIALLPEPGILPPEETEANVPGDAEELIEYLYIAESTRVIRLPKTGKYEFGEPEVLVTGLPAGGNHFTRSLAIAGDKIYVSIGSSCNVCEEQNQYRASVWQYDLDGSNGRLFASGLRNSVGINFHPLSGKLWGTDNGRDILGDKLPPDEINLIEDGLNYGWPICYGQQIHDSDFDKRQYFRNPCADTAPAQVELPAHTAPLGFDFYTGTMFGDLKNDMLVALHGSWNSSVPVGYKVVRVDLDGEKVVGVTDFITGWLVKESVAGLDTYSSLGRPVDVISGPRGEIFISDDKAGLIYRLVKSES